MNTVVSLAQTVDAQPINAGRVDVSKGTTIMDASMNWMRRPADERFLSLRDMWRHARSQSLVSREKVVAVKNVELLTPEVQTRDDFNKLRVGLNVGDGFESFNFSHWSFGQLSQLAGAPPSYLRTLPSPIVADAVMYGLRNNRSNPEAKFYTSDKQLLAATGPDYGRIPNHEVIEAVGKIAGDGVSNDAAWRVPGMMSWSTMMYDPFHPVTTDTTTLFMSDRDMFIFLTDPHRPIVVGKTKDGMDDVMYRGFIISQSEVGKSSLWLKAFLFRGVCCNRIIWGADNIETVRISHTKGAPERWIRQVEPALIEYAKASDAKIVQTVQNAKAAQIAQDDDEMVDWLNNRGLSRSRARSVLEAVEREEGRKARTIWDVTQGVTAIARELPNTDDRVELETLGGKLFGLAA
ncbi:DUF932 domain-containing protein [Bradyrhizobium viridifuturi]|jgi:hypothetical protein|nr:MULTISPECIES: DUF932 domain-containing protein [Bacteria]KAH2212572.1 hypothetical protein KXW71_005483 [Aspergillus fumigatus]MBR1038893.1 DUF932 domain-containing protein [Bradyrhizobium viridifuturi]MCA3704587.1 DUF932 domain-containing protein [Methylobacterium sp.]OYU64041.1 MAG: DUF932 domain-containing protein [Bradyrhizobium sp. PARBB1]POE73272.1 hypothetical protein CFP56_75223 [Quercus suber]RRB68506.1 DUF932 domain-containing protein [Escherichia coli]DAR98588.1 MAG TPA: protei